MNNELKETTTPVPGEDADLPNEQPNPERIADHDLIQWSLSLSPEARLEVLQDFVDSFWTPAHG